MIDYTISTLKYHSINIKIFSNIRFAIELNDDVINNLY